MIAYADDEQFLSIVQTMSDLDFNDSLDESRFTRTYGRLSSTIWEA